MRERCPGPCQASALAAWQQNQDGPEEGKAEGGANVHEQCEQCGGKESGDGARGRGGHAGAQT